MLERDRPDALDRYIALNREFHARRRTFAGRSAFKYADRIKALVAAHGCRTMLDYGCGKGQQYVEPVPGTDTPLRQYLGVSRAQLYDPAVDRYATRPKGVFDLVICTDVLEHVPEEAVMWVIADLFGYASKAVFAAISTRPAKRKRLSTGENVHVTVKPAAWWTVRFDQAAKAGVATHLEFAD